MHGQFVWYELTTPDVDAAMKFYPRFTGWGTMPFDENYTMFTSGGAPVAGIFRLTDEMKAQGIPPNWMPYVEADDVAATAAKAKSLGGQVMVGPAEIPGTGHFAVVADPQGAVFGLYKSSGPSMAWDGTYEVGRFSWHELMTTDYHKAAEFYSALFGWQSMGEMDMGDGLMYSMFGKDGKMYGGMYNRMPGMEGMHPFWLVYIHVKDVPKAFATATKAGAFVHRPPMDIPGGVIAILGDPQGAGFAVHHENTPALPMAGMKEPAAAPKSRKSAKRVAATVVKAVKKAAKKAKRTAKRVAATVRGKVGKKTATKTAKKAVKKVAKTSAKRPARAAAKSKPKSSAKKRVVSARPAGRAKTTVGRGRAAKRSTRPKAGARRK